MKEHVCTEHFLDDKSPEYYEVNGYGGYMLLEGHCPKCKADIVLRYKYDGHFKLNYKKP